MLQRFVREYDPVKWGNCGKNLPVITNFIFTSGIDKFNISGDIQVVEKITGNLQFTVETVKCSMNMKECQRYVAPVTFDNMCEIFNRKMRFYTIIFESIEPQLKCPIMPGNHTINPLTVDLGAISIFPLDGSMWVITFKIIDKNTKKMIMCLNSETKIVRKRVKN